MVRINYERRLAMFRAAFSIFKRPERVCWFIESAIVTVGQAYAETYANKKNYPEQEEKKVPSPHAKRRN